MTYFSRSVGSKFDIQLLNAYLQKELKFMDLEILKCCAQQKRDIFDLQY